MQVHILGCPQIRQEAPPQYQPRPEVKMHVALYLPRQLQLQHASCCLATDDDESAPLLLTKRRICMTNYYLLIWLNEEALIAKLGILKVVQQAEKPQL